MKNTLDEVLEYYEKKHQKKYVSSDILSESSNELWEYFFGDGNVQHLYNYYDLMENG